MATIQQFMTAEQADAYAFAASLSAAGERDRAAWTAGVLAQQAAEKNAIASFVGEVKLNRHGQPHGGVHPALAQLSGYLPIAGCYAEQK